MRARAALRGEVSAVGDGQRRGAALTLGAQRTHTTTSFSCTSPAP
jgi:hypothetical protein